MSSQIFRPPVGLLGYLDTKAVGQNPSTLEADVKPVLDIGPWTWNGVPVTGGFASTAALSVPGPQGVAAVPANEVWRILGMTAVGNPNGVFLGSCYFAVGAALRSSGSHVAIGGELCQFEVYGTGGADQRASWATWQPQQDTFLRPTDQLMIEIPYLAGGGGSVTFTAYWAYQAIAI
jgi:hypothetical protein